LGQPRLAFDQFANSIAIVVNKISSIFNWLANEVNANPFILSNSGSKVTGVSSGAFNVGLVFNIGSGIDELSFGVQALTSIINVMMPKKIGMSLFFTAKLNSVYEFLGSGSSKAKISYLRHAQMLIPFDYDRYSWYRQAYH
jgi:hypothetical protein